MVIKKRDGFDLGPILKQLTETRTVNQGGSVSYPIGTREKFESYFITATQAEGKSAAFVGYVVKRAMSAEQVLDEKKFIGHANRIANRLESNRKPMKVVFPVWGSKGLMGDSRQWGGVRISFDVDIKSRFLRRAQRERLEQIERRGRGTVLQGDDFSNLPLAVCSVKAINAFDAFELAESAISTELGLYSLIFSRRRNLLLSGSSERPISTILLAPHMTVHDPTGKLFSDVFWFNPWPNGQRAVSRTQDDVKKIQESVATLRKQVRKLPWRSMAELALARHYEAFSQKDLEASFLDGWRLLEAIGGGAREKSETLVRRAAWFFEEPLEWTQYGLHLMHRRNLISHGRPVRADDNEGLAFQMKEFLTPMLLAVLTNPYGLKSIEEFWDFCDLPTDQGNRNKKRHILNRQLHLLQCAAKFRR